MPTTFPNYIILDRYKSTVLIIKLEFGLGDKEYLNTNFPEKKLFFLKSLFLQVSLVYRFATPKPCATIRVTSSNLNFSVKRLPLLITMPNRINIKLKSVLSTRSDSPTALIYD